MNFLRKTKTQTQFENPPTGLQIVTSSFVEPPTGALSPVHKNFFVALKSNPDHKIIVLLIVVCLVGISALTGASTILLHSQKTPSKKSLTLPAKNQSKTLKTTPKSVAKTTQTSPTTPTAPTTLPNITAPTTPSKSTAPVTTTPSTTPSASSLSQQPEYDGTWTGYALDGSANEYTMAEARVVVPTITCPSTTQGAQFSMWVGLDGADGGNTVEQDGIRAMCDTGGCSSNCTESPDYYVWFEMYPAPLYEESLAIEPGDTVLMQVSYISSSDEYEIYLDNESASGPNASYTSYQTCPSGSTCARSSAEWISENHLDDGTLISLFGSASFSSADVSTSTNATPTPFTDYTNNPIEAVYNGQQLESVTYPLAQGANGFTINQLVND